MHRIGLVLASEKRQDVPVTRWLDAISPLPRVTRSLCLGTVSTLLSRCASPRGSFSRAQFALGAAKASSAVLKLTLYTPAFASGHGHPFNWSATKSLQSTPCGSCSGDFAGGNINPSPATHPHPNSITPCICDRRSKQKGHRSMRLSLFPTRVGNRRYRLSLEDRNLERYSEPRRPLLRFGLELSKSQDLQLQYRNPSSSPDPTN